MKTDGKWWDQTWNPVTGCTPVSAGCEHCWAKAMHARFANGKPFSEITLHHDRLEQPLHWRKPRRVAVCLMGDLFHKDVPFKFIENVFEAMWQAPQHICQILTKRPERMQPIVRQLMYPALNAEAMLKNIWLGTSVENQQTADERIPHLLNCPAAMRFVSIEPMLGEIRGLFSQCSVCGENKAAYPETDHSYGECRHGVLWQPQPDWIIIGSESGPGARPMELDWVRSIRNQCRDADIPLWYKQNVVNGKRVNMPELDGVVYDKV